LLLGGAACETDSVNLVVCRRNDGEFGLIVDEITDIIDEAIHDVQPAGRSGLLGSAVIGGQMTDFLDVEAVVNWGVVTSTDDLERLQAAVGINSSASVLTEMHV